ncbi:MAG TPA: ATP synthase F0 subunit B [Pyrinomonadaceae bacterium]|nr:ATP synthase F0 subunit B [Pyrinomonadaceae bacterium]
MFLILSTVILLSATGGSTGGFTEFYDKYLNYPGFELWKFINLGIFIAILVYLVKTPLTATFKARREAIRAELIQAEQDRQAALADLTATEAKLAGVANEKSAILKRAQEEAEAEKQNIATQTETDVTKMREQADNELNRLTRQSRLALRRFSAEESVRLAEEKLRGKINADSDAVLVKSSIEAMGGLN